MSNRRKVHTVTVGNVPLRVTPHKLGWRVRYKNAHGASVEFVRASLEDAIADAKAKELNSGTLDLTNAPPDKLAIIRRILDMDPSHKEIDLLARFAGIEKASVNEVKDAYLGHVTANAGRSHRNEANTRAIIKRLAKNLGERAIHEISTKDLTGWIADHGDISPRYRLNLRRMLVTFFKWARTNGNLPADVGTAAERLHSVRVEKKTPLTWTPDEMKTMLKFVHENYPAYIPWLVLNGFEGIRVDEIFNDPKSDKSPLDWGDFDWKKGNHQNPPEDR